MPPRRISAENARETLVTKFARAEASAGMDAATPVDDSDPAAAKQAREEHLKLVREAGRAALEESLLSSGVKRKASEMTPAGIAAQWQAYAEVYGTNGMAAGGGRSSLVRAQDEAAGEGAVVSSQTAGLDAKEEDDEAAAGLVDAPQPRCRPSANREESPPLAVAAAATPPTDEPRRLALWDF